MSYLLTSFGASEPFARASELLSEALGFSVSPTAVQRNTEAVGERVSDNPYALIDPMRGVTSQANPAGFCTLFWTARSFDLLI